MVIAEAISVAPAVAPLAGSETAAALMTAALDQSGSPSHRLASEGRSLVAQEAHSEASAPDHWDLALAELRPGLGDESFWDSVALDLLHSRRRRS
jgi:hypothetical protein